MKIVEKKLLKTKNSDRDAYVWNSISAMENSFQMVILMLVVTRLGGVTEGSIIAIAYAIANLVITIGKYGVRNYQVTDVQEKYNFKEYVIARFLSCAGMLLLSLLYIVCEVTTGAYSLYKAGIVFGVCLLKLVDAYEDVIHGRLQQIGKLYLAGKILSIRLFLYLLVFTIAYALSRNLLITVIITLFTTIILGIILNGSVQSEYSTNEQGIVDKNNVSKILRECFPLCISSFLMIYIFNAPKYIIDAAVSEEVQTCFNIVFMPVFVVTLLSTFVFQPILNNMAYIWEKRDYTQFTCKIIRQMGIILGITCFGCLAGWILGIPLLEFLYGVSLAEYRSMLTLLIFIGGIIAFVNFMNIILTTVRKLNSTLIAYGIIAGVLVSGGKFVLQNSLMALCVFYMTLLIILAVIFCLIYSYSVKKRRKKHAISF